MLHAFVSVARHGSVTAAAETLGRTQPSVSSRIDGLERRWNTRLFRRVARGMELTPEGARLLPTAETVLAGLDELGRLAGVVDEGRSVLRVGAGDALGRELLPAALARLGRGGIETELHLREGPGPVLLKALRDGEIDLALVVDEPVDGQGPRLRGIRKDRLLQTPVVLLQPAPPRGTTVRRLTLRSVSQSRVVSLQPGSAFRRHLEREFAAAGLAFRPTIEVGNLSLVRRFVAAGLGVAPVPRVAFDARREPPGCRVTPVSSIGDVAYSAAVRDGAPLPATVDRLLEELGRSRSS
ncbi:MAG: LysR family transcriptional regulator [Acidobacteriota bacterium]|nr:LysR family transcriptional regulator [Acidobacteriota bacterium]MDH3785543.1 LysR family transcriptional regulator [Acidobacteriota bacterium]